MTTEPRSKNGTVADYPALAAQFDVKRNGARTPEQVNAGTNDVLWWFCPVAPDHRWFATGSDRLDGHGCPACAGKQVSVSNCLAKFPELAGQFDRERNGKLTPEQIIAGTNKRLWWACPVAPDHRWYASGSDRLRGNGCPACAGLQVSVTNCLAKFPQLAGEFDRERNGKLTPEQIIAGTNKRLWWICRVGEDHRWLATGANRLHRDSGCLHCKTVATSAREVRLACELAAVLPGLDPNSRRLKLAGHESLPVDILDPTRKLAVEYDGAYWHGKPANERRDRDKTKRLVATGYTVIRVRELPLRPLTAADVTVDGRTPIHLVTAEVLDRLTALRPDLFTADQAAAYRTRGQELARQTADGMLAAARDRAEQKRRTRLDRPDGENLDAPAA